MQREYPLFEKLLDICVDFSMFRIYFKQKYMEEYNGKLDHIGA